MIESAQTLDIEKLMMMRVKTKQSELQPLLKGLMDYITEKGANKSGFPVSATYAIDPVTSEMDIAFYIPVDREIQSYGQFIYKPRLRLENCVKITHKGNPGLLEKTVGELNQYITENGLTPISAGFNVNRNEITRAEDLHLFEVDVYVSVSPNII